MTRLGQMLHVYRLFYSMTVEEFAKATKMSKATVCRIEAGKEMSGANLRNILVYLMGDAEPSMKGKGRGARKGAGKGETR